MRVLIDECAPRALKRHLASHGYECLTVQEVGWSGKQNGELLGMAESAFDIFVTVDVNLGFQQNLAGRRISIVILHSSSNRLEDLEPYFPACRLAIEKVKPGEIVQVGPDTLAHS
jgi:predicted nuclease of predicted toxin-antitoxin system